jgi:hypothetical protein
VGQESGPVAVRRVGEHLGLPVEVRGKLEPLRGKLSKLADCGWLCKLLLLDARAGRESTVQTPAVSAHAIPHSGLDLLT